MGFFKVTLLSVFLCIACGKTAMADEVHYIVDDKPTKYSNSLSAILPNREPQSEKNVSPTQANESLKQYVRRVILRKKENGGKKSRRRRNDF